MDKDQVDKLTAALAKVREDLKDDLAKLRDRQTPAEERTTIQKKLSEANAKAVETVLKPEQVKRLHQIENQQAGIGRVHQGRGAEDPQADRRPEGQARRDQQGTAEGHPRPGRRWRCRRRRRSRRPAAVPAAASAASTRKPSPSWPGASEGSDDQRQEGPQRRSEDHPRQGRPRRGLRVAAAGLRRRRLRRRRSWHRPARFCPPAPRTS